MATIIYSEQFVMDKLKAALPKSWIMTGGRTTARKEITREWKLIAFVGKKAGQRTILISLRDRTREAKFKELAKIPEKYGYKVVLEIR